MEVDHADFFSFLGMIAKVLIAIIGVRLLIMVLGIRISVPLVDPAIRMILRALSSLGMPGFSF